jgi:hypothetical protein
MSDDIREYIVNEVHRATAADTRISDPSWNKMSSAARRLWSSLNPDDRLIILGETAKPASRNANVTEITEVTELGEDPPPEEEGADASRDVNQAARPRSSHFKEAHPGDPRKMLSGTKHPPKAGQRAGYVVNRQSPPEHDLGFGGDNAAGSKDHFSKYVNQLIDYSSDEDTSTQNRSNTLLINGLHSHENTQSMYHIEATDREDYIRSDLDQVESLNQRQTNVTVRKPPTFTTFVDDIMISSENPYRDHGKRKVQGPRQRSLNESINETAEAIQREVESKVFIKDLYKHLNKGDQSGKDKSLTRPSFKQPYEYDHHDEEADYDADRYSWEGEKPMYDCEREEAYRNRHPDYNDHKSITPDTFFAYLRHYPNGGGPHDKEYFAYYDALDSIPPRDDGKRAKFGGLTQAAFYMKKAIADGKERDDEEAAAKEAAANKHDENFVFQDEGEGEKGPASEPTPHTTYTWPPPEPESSGDDSDEDFW